MQLQFIKALLLKLGQYVLPTRENPFPLWDCINELIQRFGAWLDMLSQGWHSYAFILDLFKCSRVTLFILAFAALFLLLPDSQGQELTIRLSSNLLHSLIFLLGVFLWAFQAWIGTRKVLETIEARAGLAGRLQSGLQHLHAVIQEKTLLARMAAGKQCCLKALQNKPGWIDHWPRILGLAVFLISTYALWLPVKYQRISFFSLHGLLIAANLGLAALFYWLMMHRRVWVQQACEKKGIDEAEHWANFDRLHASSSALTIAYVLTLLAVTTFFPVWLGFAFGAAGIAVLGFGALTSAGNFIIRSIVAHNGKRYYGTATQFPVLSILLAIAVLFSFVNDNHEVRLLSTPLEARPELKSFARQWAERQPGDATSARPMIFVATAGGGIRAAHWTLAVLTYLTDKNPQFAESVFAVSGVSGGSVGAAFYNSMVKENIACEPGAKADCLQGRAQAMLSHDFLGPNVAALLFNDLVQRFLPIGILPDRQKALEKGWEKAWSLATSGTGGLASPYSGTWAKPGSADKWLPLLLLNSTHMETGKKVITSPFPLEVSTFPDDVDLIRLLGDKDMPLSAAAGNSARFTYVSPPGTLPFDGGLLDFSQDNGHLIDGGYFENNATLTLLELLQTMQNLQADNGAFFFERYAIKPIVVLITNDNNLVCNQDADGRASCPGDVSIEPEPQLTENMPASTDFNGKFMRLTDNDGANEILGPILGILNSREGHGIAGAKNLIAWVKACQSRPESCHLSGSTRPEFFHFRIDLNAGENPPALGWVLSGDSENLIWNKIKAPDGMHGSEHNSKAAKAVLDLL
ncbi:MAG: hypothetical protein ACU83V_12360 [Gammaproteobacteria bacterium]